jgi:hypothetical protein
VQTGASEDNIISAFTAGKYAKIKNITLCSSVASAHLFLGLLWVIPPKRETLIELRVYALKPTRSHCSVRTSNSSNPLIHKENKKEQTPLLFSPLTNYIDRAAAAGRRN